MITLIFVVVIIVVVAAFSAQNAAPVAVSFLMWRFEASLALVIVLSLLAGVVIGMAVLSWLRLRRSFRSRRKADGGKIQGPANGGRLNKSSDAE